MHKPNLEIDVEAYESEHIERVLAAITTHFQESFDIFSKPIQKELSISIPSDSPFRITHAKSKKSSTPQFLTKIFSDSIKSFENEHERYKSFFDIDALMEYEIDPNSFKGNLRRECPIIRRCLNSPEREMERYKAHFQQKTGEELWRVITNIIKFGLSFNEQFDSNKHESVIAVQELGLDELLMDEYISYQVIGGGIKSHFLYSLYPHAFANRSQNALWALYFLSGKESFGLKDDSEFLMIDTDKGTTQQNYHYPYDLFAFYALKIFLLLKQACNKLNLSLEQRYRYVYLDTFLESIASHHENDIHTLKRAAEYAE
jgi:hypothetical protein